jgi:DNA-binding MarR family transcriptional regulator
MSGTRADVSHARQWGLLFEQLGLPRIAGAIWGWLLVSNPPAQSQEELVAVLGVAKGSVSTNARLLERSGLVERVVESGSRSAKYRIRADAYESLMRDKLEAAGKWRRLADAGIELARTNPSIRTDRLQALRQFYAFIEREQVAMMKRWRNRR